MAIVCGVQIASSNSMLHPVTHSSSQPVPSASAAQQQYSSQQLFAQRQRGAMSQHPQGQSGGPCLIHAVHMEEVISPCKDATILLCTALKDATTGQSGGSSACARQQAVQLPLPPYVLAQGCPGDDSLQASGADSKGVISGAGGMGGSIASNPMPAFSSSMNPFSSTAPASASQGMLQPAQLSRPSPRPTHGSAQPQSQTGPSSSQVGHGSLTWHALSSVLTLWGLSGQLTAVQVISLADNRHWASISLS